LILRVFDTAGQIPPQTVGDPAPNPGSAWWPDGDSIVHGSRTGAIVRRSVRDMAEIERVKDDGFSSVADVAPDGKTIAIHRFQTASDPGVWLVSWPDGKRTLVDGDSSASFGSFSSDGRWFAYARTEPSYGYVVRVVPVTNPSELRRAAHGYSPAWSADGKEIWFARGAGVWAVRITGDGFGEPRSVFEGYFLGNGQGVELHPDGRLLLAVPRRQQQLKEIRVIPNWLAKVTAGW
jgi:Tol biopolymer transport system component